MNHKKRLTNNKMDIVVKCLILFGLCAIVNSTCSLTPDELHAARVSSIKKEAERFYLDDYDAFVSLSKSIVNETTITHFIQATGLFGPQDAISYAGNLIPRAPYNIHPSIRQFPTPDLVNLAVLNADLYRVPQTMISFVGYNAVTDDYDVKFDGNRNVQYFFFDECSDQINYMVSTLDPDQNAFYLSVNQPIFDPITTCQIAFGACAPTPYFNLTGFTSFEECVDQYSIVASTPSPCPAAFTSDTVICRALHAFNALFEPEVHCAHLPYMNSPVCFDRCLPECSGCDENARCVAIFNEDRVIAKDFDNIVSYSCECNEGYVGDGYQCQLASCSATYQCPSGHPFGVCDLSNGTGVCACSENLTWNGVDGTCECKENENLFWDQGAPVCIRDGKCESKWQCPQAQNYNSFKCKQFEFPNTFSPGDWCLCNAGYDNVGIEADCVCLEPKVEKWSTVQNGKVCLAPGECTDRWHCNYLEDCVIETGNEIGTCQA